MSELDVKIFTAFMKKQTAFNDTVIEELDALKKRLDTLEKRIIKLEGERDRQRSG